MNWVVVKRLEFQGCPLSISSLTLLNLSLNPEKEDDSTCLPSQDCCEIECDNVCQIGLLPIIAAAATALLRALAGGPLSGLD